MTGPEQFSERTEALWRRHLPLVRERLDLIAAAADSASAGTLTEYARVGAQQAAHQLAGVLDSYGRTGGSALARTAEQLLREAAPDALAEGLGTMVRQIRAIVEHSSAGYP